MSKNKHKNTFPAETVVESDTSGTPEKTTPVESPIVPNMSLNAADQAWVQALIEERIKNNNETEKVKREFSNFGKKLMKFLFTPAKKLDSENASIKAIISITSLICSLTAWAGYIMSLMMLATAIVGFVTQPAIGTALLAAGIVSIAVLIAVLAKAVALAGIDIEKTQNKNEALSAAVFWIAFWPVFRDFLSYMIDVF